MEQSTLLLGMPGLLVGLLAGCDPSSSTSSDPSPAAKSNGLALLVGVGEYAPGVIRVPSLAGPRNDVQRVRRVLEGRFGFAPENIRTLLDEEATHQNIVESFHDFLIQRAQADTQVVFYFAGHGSRVPDLSGREPSGADSTLVAFDSRREGAVGEHDLTDDEIASLVHALNQRTRDVLVVTDSCHSGSVSRAASSRVARELPAGRVAPVGPPEFWPEGVPFLDDDDPRRESDSFTHVGACRDWDRAHESIFTDGASPPGWYGVLTWHLCDLLERVVGPETTYNELFDRVYAATVGGHEQPIEFSGGMDRVVLSGRVGPPLPGFRAVRDSRTTAQINGGSLHGLTRGSIVGLVNGDGEELGEGEVSDSSPSSCTSRIINPERFPRETPYLRAVVKRQGALDPLRVWVEESAADLARELLARHPGVALCDEGSLDVAFRVFRDEASGLTLEAPDGFRSTADGDEISWLQKMIHDELQYRSLMVLGQQPGNVLRLAATLRPVLPSDLKRDEALGEPWKGAIGDAHAAPLARLPAWCAEYRPDNAVEEVVVFEVANPYERDVYFSVVSVSEDRGIHVIWPPQQRPELQHLQSGARRDVVSIVEVGPTWEEGRPLRDRYLVIATEHPTDLFKLEQAPTRSTTEQSPTGLPWVLDRAVRTLTRGQSSNPDEDSWGVSVVDVFVHRVRGAN